MRVLIHACRTGVLAVATARAVEPRAPVTAESHWPPSLEPLREPVERSVTHGVAASNLLALRGARTNGAAVPKNVIDEAGGYVYQSRRGDGDFGYLVKRGPWSPTVQLTDCGLLPSAHEPLIGSNIVAEAPLAGLVLLR